MIIFTTERTWVSVLLSKHWRLSEQLPKGRETCKKQKLKEKYPPDAKT